MKSKRKAATAPLGAAQAQALLEGPCWGISAASPGPAPECAARDAPPICPLLAVVLGVAGLVCR